MESREKSQRELENTFVNTGICHFNIIQKQFFLHIFCVIWMSVCVLSYVVNVCVLVHLQGVCVISGEGL
jgi:hypothetical protein